MSSHNGQADASAVDIAAELLNLQEAIGYLAKQNSADHVANQEQFRRIEEKLELWIRTNQSLMEGQQETAHSNHRLVEAILANTSEMQRTTQEQQRSASSFEKGTHLLSELEHRLKALEQQTTGFARATTDLNSILSSWKPLLERTQALAEILAQAIPQLSQLQKRPQRSSQLKSPTTVQELNASLQEEPSETTDQKSEVNNQHQSLHQTEVNAIKRWIAITRRDLLWIGRGNLIWAVLTFVLLLSLLAPAFVNTNHLLKMLQRVEKNLKR
jgi:hypothetical protein